jgi:hypothetical protein
VLAPALRAAWSEIEPLKRGMLPDAITQTSLASLRLVSCPSLPPHADGGRHLRAAQRAHGHARPTLKKTTCGVRGRVQSGFYGHRMHRVGDLPCGGMRIVVEFDLRRVACPRCGAVKCEQLDSLADNPATPSASHSASGGGPGPRPSKTWPRSCT